MSYIKTQALSLDATATSMANSISILMENAQQCEANSQIIANTSLVQCCALMIAAGAAAIKPAVKQSSP
ncbi:hypothetical protein EYS14_19445 [Alteromonadaceae bacterium M269]|nr:hypothetical protein EYS14_19445 [Alteromonadaceae bacterium M269]